MRMTREIFKDELPPPMLWIKHPDELFPMESTQTCSNCNQSEFMFISNDNYCPACGAKMDLED